MKKSNFEFFTNRTVRLFEQYFALAGTLEKNLANSKQRVDNLTQSILAKASKK
ncbi:hypothetical protein [Pseudoalteromonas sp. S4488]|uniref:hypothetical protein n=1 Tax=Pseudoalteromonas sp. S4488 TaxID=579558 RepID=UPI001BB295F2|nr:hypothetical protein [Pseudoalteromonas sp. S4488]